MYILLHSYVQTGCTLILEAVRWADEHKKRAKELTRGATTHATHLDHMRRMSCAFSVFAQTRFECACGDCRSLVAKQPQVT